MMFNQFMSERNRRRREAIQVYQAAAPGSNRTILVNSHIWWVDCIAHALLELGFNVVITEPWYLLYSDERTWGEFDRYFQHWIEQVRAHNVQLILGGNASAIAPHPATHQLLHRSAGVPLVNYWWDEPRQPPPFVQRGIADSVYRAALRDDQTLNAIWDRDVCEEMSTFFDVTNSIHVPLATTPELWPPRRLPMRERTTACCFLGNCFHRADWESAHDAKLVERAKRVGQVKCDQLDRSMVECVREAASDDETLMDSFGSFHQWALLEVVLRQRLRYDRIRALAQRLGDQLVLCGQGWEALDLKPHQPHSGVPGAADYYLASKASLNLFGGCVHSGMPLRPYEIACSGGLIFTQYNRELPELFEPGGECVTFRDEAEMLAQLERILHAPEEFDLVIEAGRRRVHAHHTWKHRMVTVISAAIERFQLPWKPLAT